MIRIILTILILAGLSGCESFGKKEEAKEDSLPTVEELYNEAKDLLSDGKYSSSVLKFEEVERTYPYSKWAIKAQVMAAYASYQQEEYNQSLDIIDRFTRLHPGNKDISYMYYLRALNFYDQIVDPGRDQTYTILAQNSLQEVVARFPESEYSRDAKLKLDLTNDYLAARELTIGRFYLKRGNYIGAINRFRKLVNNYDTTVYIPEALHRIVESYMLLGLKGEAQKYAAVLGHNFPGNKWYVRSYNLIEGKDLDINKEKNSITWGSFVEDAKDGVAKLGDKEFWKSLGANSSDDENLDQNIDLEDKLNDDNNSDKYLEKIKGFSFWPISIGNPFSKDDAEN